MEGLVVRARQERAVTQTDLEYARTLTRISRTVTRYSSLSGLDGGAGLFGSAHDTLRDVIAVQETWLEVDEPAAREGPHHGIDHAGAATFLGGCDLVEDDIS
jgi:hypothetical protein